MGQQEPVATFANHTADINMIRWDPSKSLLASASDDATAIVWSIKDGALHVLRGHDKEVYAVQWAPHANPLMLATCVQAFDGCLWCFPSSDVVPPHPHTLFFFLSSCSGSYDALIKLWDATTGVCLRTLRSHTAMVYSVAFSPSGEFLASGAHDNAVHIWSTKDGSLLKSYKGPNTVYEVSWNGAGDKVAACFAGGDLAVVEMKK